MSAPKPTIDLGYPTEPHGRIPAFNSVEEEAEFWDTHDITDFLEESQPVDIEVSPELLPAMSVPLDSPVRDELIKRARAMATDPVTLARTWIEERLRQEAEADAAVR